MLQLLRGVGDGDPLGRLGPRVWHQVGSVSRRCMSISKVLPHNRRCSASTATEGLIAGRTCGVGITPRDNTRGACDDFNLADDARMAFASSRPSPTATNTSLVEPHRNLSDDGNTPTTTAPDAPIAGPSYRPAPRGRTATGRNSSASRMTRPHPLRHLCRHTCRPVRGWLERSALITQRSSRPSYSKLSAERSGRSNPRAVRCSSDPAGQARSSRRENTSHVSSSTRSRT